MGNSDVYFWGMVVAVIGLIIFDPVSFEDKRDTIAYKLPTAEIVIAGEEPVHIVSAGESLYVGTCAGCHGPNGEGGFGPALTNETKEDLLEDLRGFRDGSRVSAIMNGIAGNLSDQDIEDVVGWILTKKNQ